MTNSEHSWIVSDQRSSALEKHGERAVAHVLGSSSDHGDVWRSYAQRLLGENPTSASNDSSSIEPSLDPGPPPGLPAFPFRSPDVLSRRLQRTWTTGFDLLGTHSKRRVGGQVFEKWAETAADLFADPASVQHTGSRASRDLFGRDLEAMKKCLSANEAQGGPRPAAAADSFPAVIREELALKGETETLRAFFQRSPTPWPGPLRFVRRWLFGWTRRGRARNFLEDYKIGTRPPWIAIDNLAEFTVECERDGFVLQDEEERLKRQHLGAVKGPQALLARFKAASEHASTVALKASAKITVPDETESLMPTPQKKMNQRRATVAKAEALIKRATAALAPATTSPDDENEQEQPREANGE